MKRQLIVLSYLCSLACLPLLGCGDPPPPVTPEQQQQGHAHYQQQMEEKMKETPRRR